MQRSIAIAVAALMLWQPLAVAAQATPLDADTRVYLADGSVVIGRMVERSEDLIILLVEDEIFTFDNTQFDQVETLDSLAGGAESVMVREFPYISFLGGTAAFGLLAWIQFSSASDKDSEARSNEALVASGDVQAGLLASRAAQLRDDADGARLYGWSSTLVALGTLGVALYPRQKEKRVFPDLSFDGGAPTASLVYRHSF